MRPSKTDLARQTLHAHTGSLGMRERRALILCDGRRDLEELSGLLGQDTPSLIVRLVREGYLTTAPAATPAPVPTHVPAAPPSAPSTGSAPASRRSLVAAKVYLTGMLDLHRDEEARAHRARLQARQDDDALLETLADTLRFLEQRVAATLAGRIRERVLEVLPESDLPRMRARLDPQDVAVAP